MAVQPTHAREVGLKAGGLVQVTSDYLQVTFDGRARQAMLVSSSSKTDTA